jgi:hypothetical protein
MRYIPLLIIAAISLLATVVFATSVVVSTYTYQAQNGVYYQVTGSLTVQQVGFQVAQATVAQASQQPCPWTSGGTCTTAVNAGDWVYVVSVGLTANTPSGQTYTVTVSWNTGSGYTTMGQLTFTTPSSITAGQTMYFVFDTGSSSFNAPVGIVITVG